MKEGKRKCRDCREVKADSEFSKGRKNCKKCRVKAERERKTPRRYY